MCHILCLQGKVRDTYDAGDFLVIVTTDRQSAFGEVPQEAAIPSTDPLHHVTRLKMKKHPQSSEAAAMAGLCSGARRLLLLFWTGSRLNFFAPPLEPRRPAPRERAV